MMHYRSPLEPHHSTLAPPTATLLADLKIVDAGELEAQIGFDAGADIVTVLGVAHDVTIQGALLFVDAAQLAPHRAIAMGGWPARPIMPGGPAPDMTDAVRKRRE